VFLGANQDSFGTASKLAMAKGATSNYVADERGMRAAWEDVSGGVMRARKKLRSGHPFAATDKAGFLDGFHSAEEDFQRRGAAQQKGHAADGPHCGGRRRRRAAQTERVG
jgi:hypothetical protein